jgi:hypothetical protein
MTLPASQLVYEGEIYVRPIGRGIALEELPGQPHLDDWLEAWLGERHPGRMLSGFSDRVRIVVEIDPREPA